MNRRELNICHLYPKEMNIYGDTGNVLVLRRRLEWRELGVKVSRVGLGDKVPTQTDIIISGGGQDAGQEMVTQDLQQKAHALRAMAEDGVVMLVICGTYQLFGHRFVTSDDKQIPGIGVFNAETIAGAKRHIGNIVIKTSWGRTVGYENHSGLTMLATGQAAFGIVERGTGNNDSDDTEGATMNNVFGTYLHGPLLPKNPHVADELIKRAMKRKYGIYDLDPLEDDTAKAAARVAIKRPR